MAQLGPRVSKGIRIALALGIAVANAALFARSSSAEVAFCGYACQWKSGGAVGGGAVCGAGGTMFTCQAGLTECYGYPCYSPEPDAETVFEALPEGFAASRH